MRINRLNIVFINYIVYHYKIYLYSLLKQLSYILKYLALFYTHELR